MTAGGGLPLAGSELHRGGQEGPAVRLPTPNQVLGGYRDHDWELYNTDEDYSECHNLAAEHREKLIEMIGRWWAEAGKYQCCRSTAMSAAASSLSARHRHAGNKYVLYPGGSSIPFAATPKLYNRPWSITQMW